MATERANDLRAFIDFASAKLVTDASDITLDEAINRWEHENAPDEEREETIRAIREGLDEMHAGRGRPFEEFDREFRERHGLPPRR
jgi:hypothetical protein